MSPNFFKNFFEHPMILAEKQGSSGGVVAPHPEIPEDKRIAFTDGLGNDHETAANEPTVSVDPKPTVEVVSSSVHFEAGSEAKGSGVGAEASVVVPVEAVAKPKRIRKAKPAPEAVKPNEGMGKLAEEIGAKPAESKEIKSPVLVPEKPAEVVENAKTMADLGRLKGIEGVVVKPRGKRGSTKKSAESKIKVVPVATQPQMEAVPVVAKQEGKKFPFPQKGDVFQDVISGDRVVVEEIVRIKGEKPLIYFTETNTHGIEKKKKKKMSSMQFENFRVLVNGMEKTDPIKEEHPDFYAEYEKQMEKAVNAFTREAYSTSVAMEAWEEYIEEEYGSFLRGESKDPEKEKMAQEELEHLQQVEKIIDTIVKKWNTIDRYIVEQGRQDLILLTEIHAVEALLPDYVLELKVSELRRLEEQQGSDKPDIELVEKGYQRILLNRKVEAIGKKYKHFVDGNIGVAQDMPILDAFVNQINVLFASVTDVSSLEDIKGVLSEIVEIEKQMFVKKKTQESDEQEKKRKEREMASGFVRQGKKKRRGTEEGKSGRDNKGGRRQAPTKRMFASSINDEGAGSQQRNSGMARQRQENGSFSSEKQEEAQELMGQVDEVIQGKIQMAKDIFENPANAGKISDERRVRYIGYLKDFGRDAENSLADVNISGLQTILEKVKGIEFRIEPSRAPKKIIEASIASTTPVTSEKSKERTYEDLYKTLGREEEEVLMDALKEGLKYIGKEMEMNDEDTKKFIREQEEEFIKYLSQGITACFDRPSWTLAEKELFATTFVRKYFEKFVK